MLVKALFLPWRHLSTGAAYPSFPLICLLALMVKSYVITVGEMAETPKCEAGPAIAEKLKERNVQERKQDFKDG